MEVVLFTLFRVVVDIDPSLDAPFPKSGDIVPLILHVRRITGITESGRGSPLRDRNALARG